MRKPVENWTSHLYRNIGKKKHTYLHRSPTSLFAVFQTITSYDTEKYKANVTINGTIVEVIKTMVTGKDLSIANSTNILGIFLSYSLL